MVLKEFKSCAQLIKKKVCTFFYKSVYLCNSVTSRKLSLRLTVNVSYCKRTVCQKWYRKKNDIVKKLYPKIHDRVHLMYEQEQYEL